ncbi:hypothetical protein LR48_Vigan07g242700 [Vigna angularis]|uniref:Uncharacterized protein n=1 Tax=Phaseolus angularis TaxID=3914 RepID=A0A0L9V109_PHAAN|nr:hypothetical protein LR48_Vigan07g242700 [Vigna angularis]
MCYYRRRVADWEGLDNLERIEARLKCSIGKTQPNMSDQIYQVRYVRSDRLLKLGCRQQLKAHECVVNEVTVVVEYVNEVTVVVEYLRCALKAIKRLARAHSDLSVGVFAAGQPICVENKCEKSERRRTDRARRSVSGRRLNRIQGS